MATISIEFETNIQDATQAVEQLSGSFEEMSVSVKDTAKASEKTGIGIKELEAGMNVAAQAVGYLKDAYEAVISPTLELASSQRELALAGQISVEEAGKLIQVADDLKIPVATLTTAFREMAKDGLQPTFENIKKVAAEYQSIEDPTKRLMFAQESLGRSYQDMLPFLDQPIEKLDEMAASAEATGLVMSTEAVEAAREYEMALDSLNDTFQGMVVQIGSEVIPVLTDAATAFQTLVTWNQTIEQAIADHEAALVSAETSYADYVAEMQRTAEASGKLIVTQEEYNAKLSQADQILAGTASSLVVMTEAEYAAAVQAAGLSTTVMGIADAFERMTTAQIAATTAQIAGRDAAIDSNTTYADALVALKESNLTLQERLGIEQEIALATGRLTEDDLIRQETIGAITRQLDDGNISSAEYLDLLVKLNDGAIDVTTSYDNQILAMIALDKTIETESLISAAKLNDEVGVKTPKAFGEAGAGVKTYGDLMEKQMGPDGEINRYLIGLAAIDGAAKNAAASLRSMPSLNSGGGSVPGRDSGGPGVAGQSYLIGTGAQPELFTPREAGTFTPNADASGRQSGGGAQTIVVQLDSQVLLRAVINEGRAQGVTLVQVS